MQILLYITLLVICVFGIFAQNPSPPSWPTQFSTGVDDVRVEPREVAVGHWNYDQQLTADRWDVRIGETRHHIEINKYNEGMRYLLEERGPNRYSCQKQKLSGPMPIYNFDGWTYRGQVFMRGRTVDQWQKKTSVTTFNYYDIDDSNDPVLYEVIESNSGRAARHFYEFTRGAQNADIFNVTAHYGGACDNASLYDSFDRVSCNALSCQDIKNLVQQNFPPQYQNDMICISSFESGWCPGVYNGNCCYGLWQINRLHLGEDGCPTSVGDLYNPAINAKCAMHILNTQGLNTWKTWNDGDCSHWTRCKF